MKKRLIATQFVADHIRWQREASAMTQSQIAKQLGISQHAYSKIERGYTKMTLDQFFLIADTLDVAPAELFYFKEPCAADQLGLTNR